MNNYQHNQTQSHNQNTTNDTNFNPQNQPPSILAQITSACLPVLLKQFTGQDLALSSPSSNNPEAQFVLSQVLTLQQQIVNNLQELTRRLGNLETRASQQFTGLAQQIQNFKSVRLTHDRERKQIELGTNQSDFDKSRHFNQNTDNYEN